MKLSWMMVLLALVNVAVAQAQPVEEDEPIPTGIDANAPGSDQVEPPEAEGPPLPDLDAVFQTAMSGLDYDLDITSAVISVVKDGDVVGMSSWGYADAARVRPASPTDTLYRPGSISKTFTWTLVAQLVDEGKIDLDTDISAYIDQFEIPTTFDEPITMRHLLTHTAGVEERIKGLFSSEPGRDLAETLEANMPARAWAPSEASAYSNWTTALAGLIVANIEGVSFEEAVEARIFKPLGMARSTFREPLPAELGALMAEGPIRESGQWADNGFEYIGGFGPAGNLTSTAADMSQFMLMHLNGGEVNGVRVLSEKMARMMREPLFNAHPGLPSMLFGFYEIEANGQFAYGHGGNTLSFHSDMVLIPEQELGFFLSVSGPDGATAAAALSSAMQDYFVPRTLGPRAEAVADDADHGAVLGTYRTLRRGFSSIEKVIVLSEISVTEHEDGGILVNRSGNARRYLPSADGERLYVSVDDPLIRVAFSGSGDEAAEYLYGMWPAGTASRIGGLDLASNFNAALAVGVLTIMGILFGGLWATPKWFGMNGTEKMAQTTLFLSAASYGVFGTGLVSTISALGNDILFQWIPGIQLWLSLSLLGAVLTIVSIGMVVPVWTQGAWSLFGRARYTGTVLIMAGFSWVLWHWNLMGPWNG